MSEAAVKEAKPLGKAALIDVDKIDTLKQNGWRVEKLDSGFSAYEIHGDRKIGPATSIAALHTIVMKEIGNKFDLEDEAIAENSTSDEGENEATLSNDIDAGHIELDADSKGDRYLPGTAPLVNQELTAAIGKYHAIKTERIQLTNQEKDTKDELIAMCHLHENLFAADPDNTDSKIYRAGDLIARLSIKKEEKITTEIATDEA